MSDKRCLSPFCETVVEGVRGAMFTPSEGLGETWCPACVRTTKEIMFFTKMTVEMIDRTYKSYINTNLPKQVKLFLEQFTQEIVKNLGGEL